MRNLQQTREARTRVLLLIPHLGGGGAERVTEILAHRLSRDQYEIHLGLVTQSDVCDEHFPADVQVHALGARRVRTSLLPLLRLIWKIRPHLILSGMAHLNFLVLLFRPLFPADTRVVIRQNTTVSEVLNHERTPTYTKCLYRLLYSKADKIICQSDAMANDMAELLKLPRAKVCVLPNPVEVEALRAAVRESAVRKDENSTHAKAIHLLAVGRLAYEKGYDLLIEALAIVQKQYPEMTLTIAGSGSEESALRSLCYELGIESSVRFAGFVDEPFREFNHANIFVLSSRFEGMPNTLLEAAACGLPIVSTPCSGGVIELLHGQEGVWLADDVSAGSLASALLAALQSITLSKRFTHSFINAFDVENAIRAYEAVIDEELRR